MGGMRSTFCYWGLYRWLLAVGISRGSGSLSRGPVCSAGPALLLPALLGAFQPASCLVLTTFSCWLVVLVFGFFGPVSVVFKPHSILDSFALHLLRFHSFLRWWQQPFFFFFLLELEVSHRDEQGTYAVLSCVISKEICEVSLCSAVVHTLRSCLLFSDVKSCCWQ